MNSENKETNRNGVVVILPLMKTMYNEHTDEWRDVDRKISPYVLAQDYCGINKKAKREIISVLFFESEELAMKAENILNRLSIELLGGLKVAKVLSQVSENEWNKVSEGMLWSF